MMAKGGGAEMAGTPLFAHAFQITSVHPVEELCYYLPHNIKFLIIGYKFRKNIWRGQVFY